jgi:hypothetical protein
MTGQADLERYLDAAATAIGLDIAPAYRAEVLANLERTGAIAALILEFPLPDEEAEAASVFCPGEIE